MSTRKPYSQRSDAEKVEANWRKSRNLFLRGEYSMAIVRAAVSIELAANLAVRIELIKKRRLSPEFVDHLLLWANGLNGKFDKILCPLLKGTKQGTDFNALRKKWQKVNTERNSIAHSGQFKKESTARTHLELTREVVTAIAVAYGIRLNLVSLNDTDG